MRCLRKDGCGRMYEKSRQRVWTLDAWSNSNRTVTNSLVDIYVEYYVIDDIVVVSDAPSSKACEREAKLSNSSLRLAVCAAAEGWFALRLRRVA